MKVLFLCNKSPYPPQEGGPIAMNVIIEGLLHAGHYVKVLALNTNKYNIHENDIPERYKEQTGIELIYKDLSLKPIDMFFNLFTKKSYHVERFMSTTFIQKLTEVLMSESFDIVQLEMLYMTPYIDTIRKFSKAKIILRSHNIEHLIWERITAVTINPLKKLYLKHLTAKLKNYELAVMNSYDGIATISPVDSSFYTSHQCLIPVINIPFGIDKEKYPRRGVEPEFPSLFHLGAMNWTPNEEGIKWFLDNCWDMVHQKFPTLKFYLAGRMMPDWLKNLSIPNVEVVGEVADAIDFIRSKAVMIVPLFSGSGIRIKIIEGMALGKAVISTNIGAEGIDCVSGKHLLIANTPVEFLSAIERFITDQSYCNLVGENARQLIEEKHNMPDIIKRLEEFYKQVLQS